VAFDIHAETPGRGEKIRARAAETGTHLATTPADLADRASVLVSVVPADAALAAADQMRGALASRHRFLDLNSVAPATKQAIADVLAGSGATFVEGAIMAPVPPEEHRVPMLFNGPAAGELARQLSGFGMRIDTMDGPIGAAAAVKMCRSIVIKGLEALMLECTLGARAYGATDRVFASLRDSYPGIDWPDMATYMIGRVFEHGARRAAEMREVANTLRSAGIEPLMTSATVARQDWRAALASAGAEVPSSAEALLDTLSSVPRLIRD
jgi:3-hydroxyisobutyrate dehydrogenase-like beta-hydroxyacid dehydrogenase